MATRLVTVAPQRSLRKVACVLLNSPVRGVVTSERLRSDRGAAIDPKLLEILVCPLSKKSLRHDSETNELICDDLGVAYPVVNGIPHLVPTDGRLLNEQQKEESTDSES